MKKIILISLILIFSLGCNFVAATSPEQEAIVATEVSQQLTASPVVRVELDTPISVSPVMRTDTPVIPTLTSTNTPDPTKTLTPTLSQDDPRVNLGSPTWKEEFTKSNNNFFEAEDEQTRFAYEDGSLVLTGKNPNGWMGWSLSYLKPKDFYLEATFNIETCSGLDRYGLVYRAPNYEDGYFFGFSCDGKYSLRIFNQLGTLIPLTENPEIRAGSNQQNRIGIMAQGDRFAFYANGKLLQEVQESTFLEGGLFGAFISSYNTPNFTVRMDKIEYWNK